MIEEKGIAYFDKQLLKGGGQNGPYGKNQRIGIKIDNP